LNDPILFVFFNDESSEKYIFGIQNEYKFFKVSNI